jgi:hypothetical protein
VVNFTPSNRRLGAPHSPPEEEEEEEEEEEKKKKKEEEEEEKGEEDEMMMTKKNSGPGTYQGVFPPSDLFFSLDPFCTF